MANDSHLSTEFDGEDIVISGIAGRFPLADNVNALKDKLMKKEDMISNQCRWERSHPEIPSRAGRINNVEKFDATFFGIHPKQVDAMDPMSRMLLEHTFEAILDAGVNPSAIKGQNVAVIIGTCYSETEKIWFYEKTDAGGLGLTGCSRAMFANRLSYFFDFHGPSYILDTACSSSGFALDQACKIIQDGQCDAAIVGGINICLHPNMTLLFKRLGVISMDGRCKAFDEAADGYVRSEAICSVFLQKAKNAKRIYTTIVHTKTNCDGHKESGIASPLANQQIQLLREFYDECKVPPSAVSYVECHGCGTADGDQEELKTVSTIFCEKRSSPLMIGTVKSNLGHTEPVGALCGVAKLIISMETGIIPPNLHLNNPHRIIKENGIVPVVEPTPCKLEYAALNSFGFGGANAHLLFKPWYKEKTNNAAPQDDLPRVVAIAGRTQEVVTSLIQEVENRPMDTEFIGLLHSIYSMEIPAFLHRGYIVVDNKSKTPPIKETAFCANSRRPLWYCFSGMGSQWNGMAVELLRYPTFAAAVKKCDDVLKPLGIDIYNVITTEDKKIFDDVLHSFVGIAAVQIGLIDLLTEVGVVPDNLIGHSVGELGCAYADGALTAEQTILASYYRGVATNESELIFGAMAAVGLGYNDLKTMCPPEIDVACHNSSTSATISGPAEIIKKFVGELQEKKIFAREVATSNVAYHSRYIANAAPKLLSFLRKAIPNPKRRTDRWISSSVPKEKWSTPEAQLCSPEYLTNNLLSSVLFEEASEAIPADAIVVEIAPHGLLQAILKRSLKPTVTNISLTLRGFPDNAVYFAQALGKMYNVGVQLDLAKLYPPVQFPVGRGTPMIAPHLKWDHSDDWFVASYNEMGLSSAERILDIFPEHEQFVYMMDHVIDNRRLIPAASYLFFAWETHGMIEGKKCDELSVVFENVKFEQPIVLQEGRSVKICIFIHRGDGRFEITEAGNRIVGGTIRTLRNPGQEKLSRDYFQETSDEELLTKDDFYKELRVRGYNYKGIFRSVESSSLTGNKGHLAWSNNYAVFMDAMLQIRLLSNPFKDLLLPSSIRKVVIDVEEHGKMLKSFAGKDDTIPVFAYNDFETVVAGGIELHDVQTTEVNRARQTTAPITEEHRFIAYRDKAETTLPEMAQLCADLCHEVRQSKVIRTLELIEDGAPSMDQLLTPMLIRKILNLPLTSVDSTIAGPLNRLPEKQLPGNIKLTDPSNLPANGSVDIAIGSQLFTKNRVHSIFSLLGALSAGGFLLSQESTVNKEVLDSMETLGVQIIYEKRMGKQTLLLLQTRQEIPKRTEIVQVDNEKFTWIERVKELLRDSGKGSTGEKRIILVSQDPESGIIGFANCARREQNGEKLRTLLIMDKNAPRFSLENPVYAKQLELDLPVNVLKGNNWGSYRHLLLPPVEPKPCFHVVLRQKTRGDLSSLQWVEGPLQEDHPADDLIRVAYVSLNSRDLMLATGKLSLNNVLRAPHQPEVGLGLEYSGLDSKGHRVMGLLNTGSSTSNLDTMSNVFRFNVPANWTLQQAATVPSAYLTCACALYMRGNMKKGDKVLIHAGSGGIGQAAIHLALAEGCEVFTTVGTAEKRKFIRETFPGIKDDHIGNSRDTSFEQMVMTVTKGRGVDIVLNSLSEEKLHASLRCLARRGTFLEIGKYDITANSEVGMYVFLEEITFHAVMLDAMAFYVDDNSMKLRGIMEDMLRRNVVKPIVSKCFSTDEVQAAFRYMENGGHIGKVLLRIRDEKGAMCKPLPAHPRYYSKPNRTYILIGELDGISLELAHFLYIRGARNIVLVSPRGIVNGHQRMRIEALKSGGVNVLVLSNLDASDRADCQKILQSAGKLGPVDGIFNMAACPRDSLLTGQTESSLSEAVKPKAGITKRLDELSRTMCPELRHFVVFSSMAAGKGCPGQTSYGFGNSIVERICERRRGEGLPGLAVQWGAMEDVGLDDVRQGGEEEMSADGTLRQSLASCFEELDKFLLQGRPVVSSILLPERSDVQAAASTPYQAVMNMLGVQGLTNISQETTLAEIGLDTAVSVEIKQVLERNFNISLSLEDIRKLSIQNLMDASKITEEANRNTIEDHEVDPELFVDFETLLNTLKSKSGGSGDFVDVSTMATDKTTQGFIISGMNSDIAAFESFWPKLNFPTKCIRIPLNTGCETVEAMRDYFMSCISESMKNRRKFVVIGYSIGGILGIEIVRQLEKLGYSGRLVLIDGAPDYLKAAESNVSTFVHDRTDSFAIFVLNAFNIPLSQHIISSMNNCGTPQQKIEIISEAYRAQNPSMDPERFKTMALLVHQRFRIINKYKLPANTASLQSPIVLLKSAEPLVPLPQPDHGTSKVTRGKVHVYTLEGNHRSILENQKVPFLINEAISNQNQAARTAPST